jgi:hypothetical protein
MSHGVDASVNAVQAARSYAACHTARGQPKGLKLPKGHDPVLTGGKSRRHRVRRVVFLPHSDIKATQLSIPSPLGAGAPAASVYSG